MLRCPVHSWHGFSCSWEWSRVATALCLLQRHPTPALHMGRRVPKPCHKPGATSSLIIAQAARRSEAEQTVAQLLPPLPAGKILSTGIVPGQVGAGICRARESSFPQHSSRRAQCYPTAWPQLCGGPMLCPRWPLSKSSATGCVGGVWEHCCQRLPRHEVWPGSIMTDSSPIHDQPLQAPGVAGWLPGPWPGNCAPVPCRDVAQKHVWLTWALRTHKVNYNATCRRYFAANINLLVFPYALISLHKQSCSRAKEWEFSFTFVSIMSKPEVTW